MTNASIVSRISNLQSVTSEIRAKMVGGLMQFENVADGSAAEMSLDVVVGYLQQASEDACAVAEAMCSRYTTLHEMALLSELSERSFAEFLRAFALWKDQCLH